MEECKKRVQGGTKVSKIANIFQGMPSRDEDDMRGSDVTVVRTESHLSRFNTARALFEKLGEENKGFHRIEKSPSAAASFAGTRTPQQPTARSRSSSAGSVSPPRRPVVVSAVNGDRFANGAAQPPAKPVKPNVLPKPEKPDRRLNKELIEKQRNWTAHFNKPRAPRQDHDIRNESKYPSGFNERKSPEVPDRDVIPSRVYSPPLSPCASDFHVAERPTTLPATLVNKTPSTKSPSPVKSAYPATSSVRTQHTAVSPSVTVSRKDEFVAANKTEYDKPYADKYVNETSVSPQSDVEEVIYESPPREILSSKESDVIASSTPISRPSDTSSPIICITSSLPDMTESHSPVRSQDTSSAASPSPTKRSPRSPLPPLPKEEDRLNSASSGVSSPIVPEKQKSLEEDDYEPIDYTGMWADTNKNEQEKSRSSTPVSPVPCQADAVDAARSPLTSPLVSPVHRSISSPTPVQSSPSPG